MIECDTWLEKVNASHNLKPRKCPWCGLILNDNQYLVTGSVSGAELRLMTWDEKRLVEINTSALAVITSSRENINWNHHTI